MKEKVMNLRKSKKVRWVQGGAGEGKDIIIYQFKKLLNDISKGMSVII